MAKTFRLVSLGVAGLSAVSVVLLIAAGVAALVGNRATSEQFFFSVLGVWLALVVAMAFVFLLHYVVTDD